MSARALHPEDDVVEGKGQPVLSLEMIGNIMFAAGHDGVDRKAGEAQRAGLFFGLAAFAKSALEEAFGRDFHIGVVRVGAGELAGASMALGLKVTVLPR